LSFKKATGHTFSGMGPNLISFDNKKISSFLGQGELAGSYRGRLITERRHRRPLWGAPVTLQGWQLPNAVLLIPRPSVHGEEPYPTRGDTVTLKTADLKD
jgi:hypothetical protein